MADAPRLTQVQSRWSPTNNQTSRVAWRDNGELFALPLVCQTPPPSVMLPLICPPPNWTTFVGSKRSSKGPRILSSTRSLQRDLARCSFLWPSWGTGKGKEANVHVTFGLYESGVLLQHWWRAQSCRTGKQRYLDPNISPPAVTPHHTKRSSGTQARCPPPAIPLPWHPPSFQAPLCMFTLTRSQLLEP